jgi:2-polyprenyl-3-methyl-5-hydroxy-6-metoxy-1,4-benzoquinol methylase
MRNKINELWNELEKVNCCPFCNSEEKTIEFKNVQDWTFFSSPGKWDYWKCNNCNALYLDPRPTEETIGRAYQKYYTNSNNIIKWFKQLIINEILSNKLKKNVKPRLNFPKWITERFKKINNKIVVPFEIEELKKIPKGKLIDIGCGDGATAHLAALLGWNVKALEIDKDAAIIARNRGLDVETASYSKLIEYKDYFDCVICSHVIEHIYRPIEMIKLIHQSLKKNGILILSCPNSESYLKERYQENWRGLEAPRHLSIPSLSYLKEEISKTGFRVIEIEFNKMNTESASIIIETYNFKNGRNNTKNKRSISSANKPDFIQLKCIKI